MSPENALNLIEQATGLLQLNRADHQNILEAVRVLREAVKQPEQPAETPEP